MSLNPAYAQDDICSSVAWSFCGMDVLCDYRGVLFLPESKTLVVSDLHLEKGAAFARHGQLHPPYDTGKTLEQLKACMHSYQPELLISLGDSFHDKEGAKQLPDIYRHQLLSLQTQCDWIWISGNHDPIAPEGLKGRFETEFTLGNLTFRHEPNPTFENGEISGHLHPAARIARRGKSIKRACFASDGKRLIMPAFGSTTGSLSLTHPAFKGLFEHNKLVAHMLGTDRIYSVPFPKLVRK